MGNKEYYLAISTEKKSPMPIELDRISPLLIQGDLKKLDEYTVNYTYDALMRIIEQNNLIAYDYYGGNLQILSKSSKTLKIPVMCSDTFNNFDLSEFIISEIKNKNLMNKVFNQFRNITKSSKNVDYIYINKLIKENKRRELLLIFLTLPYDKLRMLKFACHSLAKEIGYQRIHTPENL